MSPMSPMIPKRKFDGVPLIGILRGCSDEHLPHIVEAVRRGGMTHLEITMNSPGAERQIRDAVRSSGAKLMIGAGTVTNTELLDRALAAGATFIVTPLLVREVITACPALSEWAPDLPSAERDTDWRLALHDVEGFGFPTAGEALELMLQLQPLIEAEQLTLHWPTAGLKAFRVVGEAGTLPQRARVLDPSLPLREGELRIDVERLNVDAASFRQLEQAVGKDPGKLAKAIEEIVAERGKMQNPVTGSGGMLLGRVAEIGPKHPAQGALARAAGAWVVLVNGRLAAYLSKGGRQLWTFLPEEEPARSAYAQALVQRLADLGGRPSHAREGLLLDQVDGADAEQSPLVPLLEAQGFSRTSQGLLLRRGQRPQAAGASVTDAG